MDFPDPTFPYGSGFYTHQGSIVQGNLGRWSFREGRRAWGGIITSPRDLPRLTQFLELSQENWLGRTRRGRNGKRGSRTSVERLLTVVVTDDSTFVVTDNAASNPAASRKAGAGGEVGWLIIFLKFMNLLLFLISRFVKYWCLTVETAPTAFSLSRTSANTYAVITLISYITQPQGKPAQSRKIAVIF